MATRAEAITRHLHRFLAWLSEGLGHHWLSAVIACEVSAWRVHLAAAGALAGT
ncbi:hypothetical protein [Nonomuraea jiangxiensis]|uniref:Uncharacterized protein n=1 Tax=Nonomuraea jiangxiensis TaxID=633440 RepID=A0A1G9Q4H0_9ACTN|nr:hypothetical protein [Nonomuraea jiangxiensis]SDM05886.1 hypothetical protein SAMN05421869_13548 [Nonomuraea jiangxiensis]